MHHKFIRSRIPPSRHLYKKKIHIETLIFTDGSYSVPNKEGGWDIINYNDNKNNNFINKIFYDGQYSGKNDIYLKNNATLYLNRLDNNSKKECVYRGLITNIVNTGKRRINGNKSCIIYELTLDTSYIHNNIKPNTILKEYNINERPEYHGRGSCKFKRSAGERLGYKIKYNEALKGIININNYQNVI